MMGRTTTITMSSVVQPDCCIAWMCSGAVVGVSSLLRMKWDGGCSGSVVPTSISILIGESSVLENNDMVSSNMCLQSIRDTWCSTVIVGC